MFYQLLLQRCAVLRIKLFLVILLSISTFAQAQSLSLYGAEVVVSGNDNNSRDKAIKKAMSEVLIKVSGSPRVLSVNEVQQALEAANQYVYEFHFSKARRFNSKQEPVSVKTLQAQFQPQLIKKLLKQANQPIWPDRRSSVVLWLALDGAANNELVDRSPSGFVTDSTYRYVRHHVTLSAKSRGIPLVVPDFDSYRFDQKIATAIEKRDMIYLLAQSRSKYQSSSILMGYLTKTSVGPWQANWTLVDQGQKQSFTTSSMRLSDLLVNSIDKAASNLAANYAVKGVLERSEGTLLKLNGLTNQQDYRAAFQYLKSVLGVSEVVVREVEVHNVTFEIITTMGVSQLEHLWKMDKRIVDAANYNGNSIDQGDSFDVDLVKWWQVSPVQ